MSVAESWHTFMVRKTLLTHWSVCFDFNVTNTSLRHPIIRETAASLLYMDLLTILDEAIREKMSSEDYMRGGRMKNRLEMLAQTDQLLNLNEMLAINARRNVIGHELGKGASVEELEAAVGKVGDQLVAWGKIKAMVAYELHFERSQMRGLKDNSAPLEQDVIIRVKTGDAICLELKQTNRFGRVGA